MFGQLMTFHALIREKFTLLYFYFLLPKKKEKTKAIYKKMLEVIINKSCQGQWMPDFVNVEFDISFIITLKEIYWEFAIPPPDVDGWLFYLTKTVKKITLN